MKKVDGKMASFVKSKYSLSVSQSPDLLLEVDSATGECDNSRNTDSTSSGSFQEENEMVDEVETYCDYAESDIESDSGSDSKVTTSKHVVLSNSDRPLRFALKLFQDWCAKNKVKIDLKSVSPHELDQSLSKFYVEIRSKTGERYSRNTIVAIRYGMNRYFAGMDPPRNIDIIEGPAFRKSNAVFKEVVSNAPYETVSRKSKRITSEDLRKIYNSKAFSPETPQTLLFKVWFEISVYFSRNNSKIQRESNVSDFIFDKDDDGLRFVALSRRNSQTSDQIRMYEKPGDVLCPVASLEKLLTKLDSNSQYLFQRPKHTFSKPDDVWYHPEKIGRNYSSQIMARIARLAKLSTKYTNLSVKKIPPWSLEELIFQHRRLVTNSISLPKPRETTAAVSSSQEKTRRSTTKLRTLAPMMTPDSSKEDKEYVSAFQPYTRKRARVHHNAAGRGALDLETAKAEIKRVFERLEYNDCVTLINWLKQVDVPDKTDAVFSHETAAVCPSVRQFCPRQVQPHARTFHQSIQPLIFSSPLSLSQYYINNTPLNACDTTGATTFFPSGYPQDRLQPGIALTPLESSTQRVSDRISVGPLQIGPHFDARQDAGYSQASLLATVGAPQGLVQIGSLPPATLTNTSFNRVSSVQSYYPNSGQCGQADAAEAELVPSQASPTPDAVTHNESVLTGTTFKMVSPETNLKISHITGESIVWKIL